MNFKPLKTFILTLCLLLGMNASVYAKNAINFEVDGISGEIKQNVLTSLTIERRALDKSHSRHDIREFYRRSKKLVREAIEPYGYFKSQIQSKLRYKEGKWLATYHVILGQPVKINNIDVRVFGQGAANRKVLDFIREFPMKKDDIFTADSYNDAKDGFFETVNDQGYIKSRLIKSKVYIDTNKRDANIVLYMDTGPRYYFGSFHFNKTPYDRDFLRRFDIFHHNEPFSNVRLSEYQEDMNNSSYFSSVLVIPDIEAAKNHQVPVHVSIIPPKARFYNLGLGYGTFTGPRLSAGVKFSRITDTGQSLDAKLKLSSVLSGIALKYTIPGNKPLYEWWDIDVNYQDFQPKNATSRSYTASLSYLRKVRQWDITASLIALTERYNTIRDGRQIPTKTSDMLYPSLSVSYLKTNNVLRPTFGKSLKLNLQGASKDILSSTNFLQSEIKGKYLITPLSFAQFIFRGTLGLTAVNHLNDLPATLQFYAGGPSSIRGFPDSSIGPGKYLMIGSAEYRNYFFENWAAAIFYDAGKATDHFNSTTNRGVGVGLIYNSPVGPIKLYLAQAVSKKDKPYQVEFMMGPEF